MKRMNWIFWLPLILFAAFIIVFALDLLSPDDRSIVESKMVGKPLPEFTLPPSQEGVPGLASADFMDGKPKLLNLFGSWCLPCIVEAPQLGVLEEAGATIHAVALRDTPEDVARFLANHGNPFTRIGADDRSETQLLLGASGVPETFVIDGNGVIRYQHIGEIRPEHVPLLLDELAKAAR